MKRYIPHLIMFLLIIVFIGLTACSQSSGETEGSTVEPTNTDVPATPENQAQEVVQKVVIPSEVVVENFIVHKTDEALNEIEIVVQGYLTNTCTEIGEISINREGDLFILEIQTDITAVEECEIREIQFQEVVKQDISDLEPGTYLISKGPVEKYVVQAPIQAEENIEIDTTEAITPTSETTSETEVRECQDYATFLADVTYPDNSVVTTGETFTKTWEIRNDGECSWGPGYSLEGVSGNFIEVTPVEGTFPVVQPSQTAQLSLVITAPQDTGEATGSWVIERPEGDNVKIQNGENFDLWAIVNVVQGSAAFTGGEDRVLKDGVVCAQTNTDYNTEVLELINSVRVANDLPAYQSNEPLTRAAWVLSADMACNNFYDHTGSDGSTLEDRINAEGYAYNDAGESIYYGLAGIPERAFDWWMENSRDSENILSSIYTEIGIAFALNPQTGASYYTLVFAVPETQE